jgi:hypothetical protein
LRSASFEIDLGKQEIKEKKIVAKCVEHAKPC